MMNFNVPKEPTEGMRDGRDRMISQLHKIVCVYT